MSPKIVLASVSLVAAVGAALFFAPIGFAVHRDAERREPLNEEQHALVLDEVFGGTRAAADPFAAADASTNDDALVAQAPSGSLAAQGSPIAAKPPRRIGDLNWRRIDSFGIRQTWGLVNPDHASTSPIAMVFGTVLVPPAYAHCLLQYETVTALEVRLTPMDGSATTVIRSTLLPGNSAVSLVVPAALWRNARSARVLAWTSSADSSVDAQAVSDQELTP